jgi:type I restriction enzyme S subunit
MTLCQQVRPRKEKALPSNHPELPYVGLEHIEAHTAKLLGTVASAEMKSPANRFYQGDVLYSRLRPYLNKVWLADRDGLCSSEFIVIPGNDQLDPGFLRYRLNSTDFVSFANSLNAGDRPRVDFDQISSFSIPRFSLDEQRAIVAEIEKQFTRLEAGVGALKRVQANLKRYRAAVLKAACEGKLVPTEAELAKKNPETGNLKPEFETGEQLLQRILTERRKNWSGRGKYKEPAAPDTANLPELPEGWVWSALAQLATHITDGTHKTPTYVDSGVPFLSAKDISGFQLMFNKCRYIPQSQHQEMSKRCNVRRGNVLITKSGTIGRVAVVETDEEFSLFESVANVPVLPPIEPKFISIASFVGIAGAFGAANQKGVAVRHLHLEDLRRVPIPLPPLAEQKRIVEEAERRLSVIEELEASVSVNLQRASRLRQSILQKAFN